MMAVVLPKKVVDRVMNTRCNSDDDRERIEKVLVKLPFCKDGDTSMERLEKVISKYESKYGLTLAYMMKYRNPDDEAYNWSLMMKDEEGNWIETSYGLTVWESFAKMCIFTYYYVQNGCKGGRTQSG